jgi:hypothetical protein
VQLEAASRVFGAMKRLSLALIALSLASLVFLGPAVAQPGEPARPATEKVDKKVKVLTIEAIDVGGDRVTGKLAPISIHQASKHTSLIRIRRDYIDLILKSAQEI